MATLDLLTPAAHPDGWRRVRAPGGYESWRFVASSGDVLLIAGLHLGWAGDRRYVRRYRLFRAFPTRVVPPVPTEYPTVSLTVVRGGRVVCRMVQAVAFSEFSAAGDAGKVRMGGSHVETAGDGAIHFNLRGVVSERTVAADLVFRSKLVPTCNEIVDGVHRVAMVAPLCEVDGEIDLFDSLAGGPRVIDLDGIGCHTHHFGTRMLDDGTTLAAAFVEGRAILMHAFGDRVHVRDVSAVRCRESYSVVKESRAVLPFSDAEIAFAKTQAIDSSLSLCDVRIGANIGGVAVKTLVETIRPSGFLRSLFV